MATVRDQAARERYSTAASPILKEFGGKFIAGGSWEVLFGDPVSSNGAIIEFEDRETAQRWYDFPAYQALLADRVIGLDCRFRLIGWVVVASRFGGGGGMTAVTRQTRDSSTTRSAADSRPSRVDAPDVGAVASPAAEDLPCRNMQGPPKPVR